MTGGGLSDSLCWGVVQMELEVSYDEICCDDGQVERRTGAPDHIDGEGEAVCKDCVDRHTFFITPLSSCRDADLPSRPP